MKLDAHFVLMLIALICFFCAAINRPATGPISIGWLGVFLAALSFLVP